jgi:hypothetical protein
MDLAPILDEIDAELYRLAQIRRVVERLSAPPQRKRRRPIARVPAVRPTPIPVPVLTVLPPKLKREYRRKPKPMPRQPKALSAPISDRPIFVPRVAFTAARSEQAKAMEFDPAMLEAAFRQNLKIPSALSSSE